MPTLAEQLQELALCEQKTLNLKDAIQEFVSQERIFNMLKKALANKFKAKIPYQRFDNEGCVELEPTSTTTFSGYNAYLFTIEIEPRKSHSKCESFLTEKIYPSKCSNTKLTCLNKIPLLTY